MSDAERYRQAIAAFDRANGEDPHTLLESGETRPRELVQAERLSAWVEQLDPEASEALRLAARCQHIRRWQVPRESYPEGRLGYLKWRTELARFHAQTASRILADLGYEEALIEQVRSINLKQNLRGNPDSQTMEDALCLSFLAWEFEDFRAKHEASKVVDVVRKTWRKMSARAHEKALALPLSAPALELVGRALEG